MSTWADDCVLYGIVDLGYLAPAQVANAARELILGGAGILQLRAKGFSPEAVLALAEEIQPVCKELCIPLIINDFVEVAKRCNAAGVHLGQDDGPLAAAREILGPNAIIGRSTHSPEQAIAALNEGADCIGFGPLFATPTKPGRPAIGTAGIADVQRQIGTQIPVFCIGGIQPTNLDEVVRAGARRCVVVSALLQANDIRAATQGIVAQLRTAANDE